MGSGPPSGLKTSRCTQCTTAPVRTVRVPSSPAGFGSLQRACWDQACTSAATRRRQTHRQGQPRAAVHLARQGLRYAVGAAQLRHGVRALRLRGGLRVRPQECGGDRHRAGVKHTSARGALPTPGEDAELESKRRRRQLARMPGVQEADHGWFSAHRGAMLGLSCKYLRVYGQAFLCCSRKLKLWNCV